MYKKYNFDELDLEFIFDVQQEISKRLGDTASQVILHSSFLTKLQEDSSYVYHFDETYWANNIITEYEYRKTLKERA